MKIIGIENEEEIKKKIIIKKRIYGIIVALIIILIIILSSMYVANLEFRNFIDFKILRKEVTQNDVISISLDESQNGIFSYDNYIVVLKDNKLIHYSSSAKVTDEIDIQINNPIIDKNNKYLIIGEKDKQKLYLISNGKKVWEKDEKDIEGNLTRVCVNKNGYSAIILSGTTHKSVVEIFDNNGKKIFTTYLSNTTAMDVDISNDNKYMSIAEMNTNGTKISSNIKTISIDEAKVLNTYESKQDLLVLNIKYQDQNKLICMYDKKIYSIKDGIEEEFLPEDSIVKNSFVDIELSNNIVMVQEKSSLFKSKNDIEIVNTGNKSSNMYFLDGVTKQIYCYDNKIAINLGSEVQFIGTNGWLIKKYTSNQEVVDVVMCNNYAGIIYRNRIEIVNL